VTVSGLSKVCGLGRPEKGPPTSETAAVGVLLVGGLSRAVLRLVGTIWVNRRRIGDARATVHSLLAQAEYFGEIIVGLSLALVVRSTTVTSSLTCAAFIMLAAAVLVRGRASSGPGSVER
jgi:hypothetical protein